MSETAAQPSPVRPVPRPVPPEAPGQGRWLARRHRARRRRSRPARGRRGRLAARPLGSRSRTFPPGYIVAGLAVPDRPDALRRALVLRHPARGLPGPGRVLADRDRLRRRRGDEQLPARQHRHVRDAGHVHRHHSGRDVRGRDRRVPRAEDLLHDRRHVRLPLPVPVRARLVRREPRQHLRGPCERRS